MQQIRIPTTIHRSSSFISFMDTFKINDKDLIITHEFLYDAFMKNLNLSCPVLFQEKYGMGEPSDEMMNAILKDMKKFSIRRIIAIGGGTVLDIAKVLVLKNLNDVKDAFERTIPLEKGLELIAIPTTCGTGSEVTNITIAEIKAKQTKMGLADDTLFPDHAVLIPELLKGLPYSFYLYSSVDALIHATEAYVSPKANAYTKLFSEKAIEMILSIYMQLAEKGEKFRFECLEEMLIASNYAGIAFGNAGVGAVHAMSYPVGGKYHVPHGEVNYQFFTEVFKVYQEKAPQDGIEALNAIIAKQLNVTPDKTYRALDQLLSQLIEKKPLRQYGMAEKEISDFAQSVLETQQRLLANTYVPLSESDLQAIYQKLF